MSIEMQGHRCAVIAHPREFICASEIPGVLSISFPPEPDLRVRRVVTRSRARRTYKCPSWKMDRMIEAESLNEMVATRLYDLDPEVISFHEQALAIRYVINNEVRSHVPDFVVRRSDEIGLDEIKDAADEQDPNIAERTEILTPLLARLGLTYRVRFVDKEIYKPEIRLIRALLKLGRSEVTEIERERANRLFRSRPDVTWGDIVSGSLGARGQRVIARLILEGSIQAGNERGPLSATSPLLVRRSSESYPDLWAA